MVRVVEINHFKQNVFNTAIISAAKQDVDLALAHRGAGQSWNYAMESRVSWLQHVRSYAKGMHGVPVHDVNAATIVHQHLAEPDS